MPQWIKQLKEVIDFLDIGYRKSFILAFISWVMILIPNNVWEMIGLLETMLQIRPWMYLFSIPATLWIVGRGISDLAEHGINRISQFWKERTARKQRDLILSSISRSEKEILLQYSLKDVTTLAFDFRNGVVNGLVAKGILYKASTASNPFSVMDFDINIQPWAMQYLNDHPELLDGMTPPKPKSKSNKHNNSGETKLPAP